MFALFHYVPYEGSDFLGAYSTLERAQAAALAYHAVGREASEDADWEFIGRLEVYPFELDEGFHVDFLQSPLWVHA